MVCLSAFYCHALVNNQWEMSIDKNACHLLTYIVQLLFYNFYTMTNRIKMRLRPSFSFSYFIYLFTNSLTYLKHSAFDCSLFLALLFLYNMYIVAFFLFSFPRIQLFCFINKWKSFTKIYIKHFLICFSLSFFSIGILCDSVSFISFICCIVREEKKIKKKKEKKVEVYTSWCLKSQTFLIQFLFFVLRKKKKNIIKMCRKRY